MKARQNRLAQLNGWIEETVEKLVSLIVHTNVQPANIASKLESAMENGTLLQRAGQRLAPNVYDIYLSIADHQRLAPGQATLIKGWQESLIEYARRKHYALKTEPILRLHGDSKLRLGLVRIVPKLEDARILSSDPNAAEGIMSTQALDPQQLALLRAQLTPGQHPSGINDSASPQQGRTPLAPASSQSHNPFAPPLPPAAAAYPRGPQPRVATPAMPWAQLTIRLPQAGSTRLQTYPIEKAVINIGRQLSNDIIVEDKRVSRNHAQIKYQADGAGGQFAIYDLGSTNGITINTTPNMRQHVLQSGDHFTIGSYDFYFERR